MIVHKPTYKPTYKEHMPSLSTENTERQAWAQPTSIGLSRNQLAALPEEVSQWTQGTCIGLQD